MRIAKFAGNLGAAGRSAVIGAFSITAFFGMTDEVAYQDAASYLMGHLDGLGRWQISVIAPPHGSIHAGTVKMGENTLRPDLPEDLGLVLPRPIEAPVSNTKKKADRVVFIAGNAVAVDTTVTGSIDPNAATASDDDLAHPVINRAAKGDFLVTRAQADLIRSAPARVAPRRTLDRGRFESGRFDQSRFESGSFAPDLFQTANFDPDLLVGDIDGLETARLEAPADSLDTAAPIQARMLAMLPNSVTTYGEGRTAGTTTLTALPEGITPDGQLLPIVYAALIAPAHLSGRMAEAERRAAELFGDGSDPSWKRSTPLNLSSRQKQCLAEAVYFEARGEPYSGQLAVAQVVVNRAQSKHWPSTICGVVYQNKRWRNRCQFSFACDGIPERIRDKASWRTAEAIAEKFSQGFVLAEIDRATHYHATYVRPRWARYFNRIDKIGRHVFYRSRTGGWS